MSYALPADRKVRLPPVMVDQHKHRSVPVLLLRLQRINNHVDLRPQGRHLRPSQDTHRQARLGGQHLPHPRPTTRREPPPAHLRVPDLQVLRTTKVGATTTPPLPRSVRPLRSQMELCIRVVDTAHQEPRRQRTPWLARKIRSRARIPQLPPRGKKEWNTLWIPSVYRRANGCRGVPT